MKNEQELLKLVCDLFKNQYEKACSNGFCNYDFETFVLDKFKSYCGGTIDKDRYGGYDIYSCSGKGCELVGFDNNSAKKAMVKKNLILKELGIKERKPNV